MSIDTHTHTCAACSDNYTSHIKRSHLGHVRLSGRGEKVARHMRISLSAPFCAGKMFACPAWTDEEIILWSRSATCWNANTSRTNKQCVQVLRPGQTIMPVALMKRSLIICLTAENCSYALLHAEELKVLAANCENIWNAKYVVGNVGVHTYIHTSIHSYISVGPRSLTGSRQWQVLTANTADPE